MKKKTPSQKSLSPLLGALVDGLGNLQTEVLFLRERVEDLEKRHEYLAYPWTATNTKQRNPAGETFARRRLPPIKVTCPDHRQS